MPKTIIPEFITVAEQHSGQFAYKSDALQYARELTRTYQRKHRVVLDRTWRNLEERSCYYVCL
jgi:hypothetical protein